MGLRYESVAVIDRMERCQQRCSDERAEKHDRAVGHIEVMM
jgi:hypothetical protein